MADGAGASGASGCTRYTSVPGALPRRTSAPRPVEVSAPIVERPPGALTWGLGGASRRRRRRRAPGRARLGVRAAPLAELSPPRWPVHPWRASGRRRRRRGRHRWPPSTRRGRHLLVVVSLARRLVHLLALLAASSVEREGAVTVLGSGNGSLPETSAKLNRWTAKSLARTKPRLTTSPAGPWPANSS